MKSKHPLFAVLILSLIFPSLASITAAQVQTDDKVDLKYRRSLTETQIDQLSNDLSKDATTFQTLDRAVLWSRLGDLWWKTDAERGRGFLLKAVQDIEAAVSTKSDGQHKNDSGQLISAIRVVTQIVASRDDKLGDRLITSLSAFTKDAKESSSSDSVYLADALVEAAMQIISDDPARAAQLGSASLRYGDSSKLNLLLIGLRDRNSKLADSLFNEALTKAQLSQDFNLFSSLTFAAFTANYNPAIKAVPPSLQLRASLLNAIIKGVIQADMTGQPPDCGFALLITPLLGEVDQIAPQQAAPVKNAVAKCKSVVPGGDEATRNQPFKTAEDFLSAAKNADSTELRTLFLSRAIQAAGKSGNIDLAISILDGMTREEREVMGDAWDPIRVQYATFAGMRNYANEDFAGIERVINAVPQELQGFVALNIAEEMLGDTREKNTVAIDLLGRARRSFEKLDSADFNTFYPYMSLVRAYGKVSPQDAYSVLREAVKFINRVTLLPKEKTAPSEQVARGQFEPLDVPAELVQLSAFDLMSIVSSVDSAALRTRLRLSLLTSLLSYRQSLLKTPESSPSKPKGSNHDNQ